MDFLMYIIILMFIALLLFTIVFELIKKDKNQIPVKPLPIKENFEDILKDITVYVNYEVKNSYEKILLPLVTREKNNSLLINDEIVNDIVINITSTIYDNLSESYLERLALVIKKENIEKFLMDLVYNTVTKLVMEMNKETIKKIKS